jgi:uncharacterized protein
MDAPSSLISAIEEHDLHGVMSLLSRGADPNAPEGDGRLPLHTAVRRIDFGAPTELVTILLEHGADANRAQWRVRSSSWDVFNGETPLLLACDGRTTSLDDVDRSLRLAVARLLLDAGADPNARRSDGELPLHLCVQAGDLSMASLLLERGADRTINERGGARGLALSALAYAASDFNVPMMELLIAAGADPQTREEGGETARDWLPPREEHDPKTWDAVIEMLARKPM